MVATPGENINALFPRQEVCTLVNQLVEMMDEQQLALFHISAEDVKENASDPLHSAKQLNGAAKLKLDQLLEALKLSNQTSLNIQKKFTKSPSSPSPQKSMLNENSSPPPSSVRLFSRSASTPSTPLHPSWKADPSSSETFNAPVDTLTFEAASRPQKGRKMSTKFFSLGRKAQDETDFPVGQIMTRSNSFSGQSSIPQSPSNVASASPPHSRKGKGFFILKRKLRKKDKHEKGSGELMQLNANSHYLFSRKLESVRASRSAPNLT